MLAQHYVDFWLIESILGQAKKFYKIFQLVIWTEVDARNCFSLGWSLRILRELHVWVLFQ